MERFHIAFTNERIIPSGGLSVVGAILGKSDFVKRANRMDVTRKRSPHQIKNGDILLTYIGLLCMGKPQYEAVRELEDDPEFYKKALGIAYRLPSQETLRQRMDDIGNSMRSQILLENVAMLTANGIVPSKLANGYVPVDLDVSPFDNSGTNKELVSRTYKGYDGYAPMFAYIGQEGYLISAELRAGSQHCQNGTPNFLNEMLPLCKKVTSDPLLFRMDSGNDAAENLGILLDSGCYFIIKHNLRKESPESWLAMAMQHCQDISVPRDGKTVYIGSDWKTITYTTGDKCNKQATLRLCYEIIVRDIDKNGQLMLEPTAEINTWWTNLNLSDHDIIEIYHEHGTMEQYHSEIKNDMDLERLPSGKFDTNSLVIELSVLAYNILRMIGQESLRHHNTRVRKTVKRRRLRTVINDLINMACHITTHARRLVLGLGRCNVWRDVFGYIYSAFAC